MRMVVTKTAVARAGWQAGFPLPDSALAQHEVVLEPVIVLPVEPLSAVEVHVPA